MTVFTRLFATAALALFGAAPFANAMESVNFGASNDYNGKPVTLSAALFRPNGAGRFPAVVLMHGCGGLMPAVRQTLYRDARELVSNGFVALIVDSFGPRGNSGGWVCKSHDRLSDARRYRVADAMDARAFLISKPFVDPDNIFQMGQSNGASVAIRLAQHDTPTFRAVAAFYPWCGAFNRFGANATLTAPLIVFGGGADDWVSPQDCTTINAHGADYRVIVYPGAVHSFDLAISMQTFQGHRVGHDAHADTDSRAQMLAFFAAHARPAMRLRPQLVAGSSAAPVFLSGAEIQQLMPTGKVKGVNGYGNPYTITYFANGTMSGVAGANDEYQDTGKWWVKDDMFCRQYSAWLNAKLDCFRVSLDGDTINWHKKNGRLVSSNTFQR